MPQLRIICSRPGYRLAGIAHPAHAIYPAAAFTTDQLRVIREDPLQAVTADLIGDDGALLASTLDPAKAAIAPALPEDFLAGVDPRVLSAAAANYTDTSKSGIPVPGLPGAELVRTAPVPGMDPAVSAAVSSAASVGTAPGSPGAVVVPGVEMPAGVVVPAAAIVPPAVDPVPPVEPPVVEPPAPPATPARPARPPRSTSGT